MSAGPLPPPCPLCAPNDGAWMETPTGLRRCTCPRGKDLDRLNQERAEARKAKARKAAVKDAESKKKRRDERITQRRQERALEKHYREMPLMEGEGPI